ncbi:MAG: Asp23/Gls24 family envelope stress response protein [Aerococcus suis]|nr:Asp23/Gls24 family envelope stress response protein [Aerococcus suis]
MSQEKTDLTFDAQAIEHLANDAVLEVDGVLATQGDAFNKMKNQVSQATDEKDDGLDGVEADVGEVEVAIDLDIVVEYGKEIPKIFNEAVNNIENEVEHSTGLDVVEVNINIQDIMKLEDFNRIQMRQANK